MPSMMAKISRNKNPSLTCLAAAEEEEWWLGMRDRVWDRWGELGWNADDDAAVVVDVPVVDILETW